MSVFILEEKIQEPIPNPHLINLRALVIACNLVFIEDSVAQESRNVIERLSTHHPDMLNDALLDLDAVTLGFDDLHGDTHVVVVVLRPFLFTDIHGAKHAHTYS